MTLPLDGEDDRTLQCELRFICLMISWLWSQSWLIIGLHGRFKFSPSPESVDFFKFGKKKRKLLVFGQKYRVIFLTAKICKYSLIDSFLRIVAVIDNAAN